MGKSPSGSSPVFCDIISPKHFMFSFKRKKLISLPYNAKTACSFTVLQLFCDRSQILWSVAVNGKPQAKAGRTDRRRAQRARVRRLADVAKRTGRDVGRISEMEAGKSNSTVDSLSDAGRILGMELVFVPASKLEEALAMSGKRPIRRAGALRGPQRPSGNVHRRRRARRGGTAACPSLIALPNSASIYGQIPDATFALER